MAEQNFVLTGDPEDVLTHYLRLLNYFVLALPRKSGRVHARLWGYRFVLLDKRRVVTLDFLQRETNFCHDSRSSRVLNNLWTFLRQQTLRNHIVFVSVFLSRLCFFELGRHQVAVLGIHGRVSSCEVDFSASLQASFSRFKRALARRSRFGRFSQLSQLCALLARAEQRAGLVAILRLCFFLLVWNEAAEERMNPPLVMKVLLPLPAFTVNEDGVVAQHDEVAEMLLLLLKLLNVSPQLASCRSRHDQA